MAHEADSSRSDPSDPSDSTSGPGTRPAGRGRAAPDPCVGVYLHVPFCERVCPYCDFAVVAARRLEPEREERLVAALEREVELRAPDFAGRRLASVYLGGGTPSLLRPTSVARLIAAAGAAFARTGPVEVTLEVNPSSVERERLPGFREAGVNRLSIGVQSFDDTTLRRLGRAHRASEAHATLAAARAVGFDSLSLDLLFGAPGQTLDQLRSDLDATLAFGPEHVSAYSLTLEEGTPFARAAASGRLEVPDDDLAADMMETLRASLAGGGLLPYEISAYARPGCESVHNRRYWQRRPVLGVGVGAWSTEVPGARAPFGGRRANERDLAAWLARVEAGGRPPEQALERLTEATARSEAIFLALRTTEGLDLEAFAEEFGAPLGHFHPSALEDGRAAGLLVEDSATGHLCLTERGVLLADAVLSSFVEPASEASCRPPDAPGVRARGSGSAAR